MAFGPMDQWLHSNPENIGFTVLKEDLEKRFSNETKFPKQELPNFQLLFLAYPLITFEHLWVTLFEFQRDAFPENGAGGYRANYPGGAGRLGGGLP